ncbi:MAG: ABC transporter ATP-binding protein, partial [Cellulosilyticaceae bacterium]
MRLVKEYILKHWKLMIIPILGMFITLGIDATMPILQMYFIDHILVGGQTSTLLTFSLIFIGLVLTRCTFGYIKEFIFDKFSLDVAKDLRRNIFYKIQSLEFSFFDKNNTGELMSRIGEDVDMVWETVAYGLRLFIEMIIIFVLCSTLMLKMSPPLAIVCLLLLVPVTLMGFFFEKKFWDVYSKISDQTAELNSVAQQNIAGIRLVKAFAREKHEITKFLDTNEGLYDLNLKQAKLVSKFVPTIEFFCNLS